MYVQPADRHRSPDLLSNAEYRSIGIITLGRAQPRATVWPEASDGNQSSLPMPHPHMLIKPAAENRPRKKCRQESQPAAIADSPAFLPVSQSRFVFPQQEVGFCPTVTLGPEAYEPRIRGGLSTWSEPGSEQGSAPQLPLCSASSGQGQLTRPPNASQSAAEQRQSGSDWGPVPTANPPWALLPSPIDHMTADRFTSAHFWTSPILPLAGAQGTSPQWLFTDGSVYSPFVEGVSPSNWPRSVGLEPVPSFDVELGHGDACLPGTEALTATIALRGQTECHQSTHQAHGSATAALTTDNNQHKSDETNSIVSHSQGTPGLLQSSIFSRRIPSLGKGSSREPSRQDARFGKAPVHIDHLDQPDYSQLKVPFELCDPSPIGTKESEEAGPRSDSEKGLRKKRARFNDVLRIETYKTRSIGACLRCHNQKVRCIPNKQDDQNPLAPCETCLKVRRDSKKTIHNLPCLRFKVTSITTYRAGGLCLTERFSHTKIADIVDCADHAIYDVEVAQGLCRNPVRLRVRRFRPRTTDVLNRKYVDNGLPKEQLIEPFCLADTEMAAKDFENYVDRNAIEGLTEAVKHSDDIVQQVFGMIARYCTPLNEPDTAENAAAGPGKGKTKSADQRDFLLKVVQLWFAIRHGSDSAWLCGKELLGMNPSSDPSSPLSGRVSVPRMIVAQFDSIRHERIYKKLAPKVLRTLEGFLGSSNKDAWFTVFLATFLILHQAACTSRDRLRYAEQNGEGKPRDTRYGAIDHPLTHFVEEVHHGAVTLLAYWQYFKRCDLMSIDWDDIDNPALMFLEPYQVRFMKQIVDRMKEKLDSIPRTPSEGCWEHELFWVSKMFVSEPAQKPGWTPPETFTKAKPSVGRVPM
ncbi:hypothetical protein VTK26DRAFT_3640 [Humicola hyalothermophila]